MLLVVAQRHQVEQQLRAAGGDRPAKQERPIVVGQRALRHKQRAVAARVHVQRHPLLALGVAAPKRVLEAARQHAVRGLLQQLAVVGRKVAHAHRQVAGNLAALEYDQLTDELERENELQVKALGEELAGELGLGERHMVC